MSSLNHKMPVPFLGPILIFSEKLSLSDFRTAHKPKNTERHRIKTYKSTRTV